MAPTPKKNNLHQRTKPWFICLSRPVAEAKQILSALRHFPIPNWVGLCLTSEIRPPKGDFSYPQTVGNKHYYGLFMVGLKNKAPQNTMLDHCARVFQLTLSWGYLHFQRHPYRHILRYIPLYPCVSNHILIKLQSRSSQFKAIQSQPIGSMYGIYANIWGILMVNVTIYSIHGSYGLNHNDIPRSKPMKHQHFPIPSSRRVSAIFVRISCCALGWFDCSK